LAKAMGAIVNFTLKIERKGYVYHCGKSGAN
jgi:hypothetical protein